MPLYKAWDTRRRKRKAVAARGFQEFVKGSECFDLSVILMNDCIVISIILNQTKFRTREGVFDISVFPLGKAFDIKIGKNVKSPGIAPPPPPPGA